MFISNFINTYKVTIHDSDSQKPLRIWRDGKPVGEGRGVFFSPNGTSVQTLIDGRKKKNLSNLNAIFADWDWKPKPGEPTGARKPELKQFLLDIDDLPTPTYVVESGNGYHAYWVLNESIDVDDTNRDELIKTVEGIHRRIHQDYDSDPAGIDVLRLLRLPGHEHRKQPDHPFMVSVVVENEDTKYTLEELKEAIPPLIKEEKVAVPGSLSGDKQERLEKMLQKDHIKRLYDGDTSNYGDDVSKADSALCFHLAFWFEKDAQVMEEVWLQSPLGQREKTQERKDYRDRTIEHAIAGTDNTYTANASGGGKTRGQDMDQLPDDDDPCPERTRFLDFDDYDNKEMYRNLLASCLANYHKWVHHNFPHLLFEEGEDKSYWNYNEDEGIYEGMNVSTVRSLVIKLMMDDGLETKASDYTVKTILNRYRAMYPTHSATFDSFVSEDNYFHVANGWLNTKTRELEPHTPARRSLFKSVVEYNPDAKGTLYSRMLDEDFMMPKDQVRVIDQFSGYLLTHSVRQQQMLVFEGPPGSGKSTIPRIWLALLGEMGATASLQSLSGSEVRFMGSTFLNKNFCFFDEANPKTENINEYFMGLADQQKLRVERKGLEVKTVRHTAKIVLSLNKMPYHQPEGFPRRHRHILFTRSFTDEDIADRNLLEKIVDDPEELSAVLNRMLAGLEDLEKMGRFTMIAGEEERKRDQTIAADNISEYLDEYFEPVHDGVVRYTFDDMKNAYKYHFPSGFNKNLSTRGFNKELFGCRLPEFRHVKAGKSNSKRGYVGIKLKDEYEFRDDGFVRIALIGEGENRGSYIE